MRETRLGGRRVRGGEGVGQGLAEAVLRASCGREVHLGGGGAVVGDVFADGPNNEEIMELIRIEEIINAVLTEAKVDVVIPPGISVTTIGVGNLGAPVIAYGATTTMGIGDGIIR